MPIRRLWAAVLLPLVFLLSLPAQAFVGGIAVSIGRATNTEGAEIPPFSADAQVETEEHQMTSQVYYQPGMVRDVMDMGGMEMVTIQRYDQGKVWVLMGQGMYMEQAIGQAEQAPEYKLIERTFEGTETIDGVETKKYKTVYEGPDGRFGGFTWFTDDNIAIKGFIVSETKGEKQRLKWTMTNVQRGDQPDALFELPPGAKPMSGMGGLMNMMGGMGGAGATPPKGETSTSGALGGLLSTMGITPPSGSDAAADTDETGVDGDAAAKKKEAAQQESGNTMQDSIKSGIQSIFGS